MFGKIRRLFRRIRFSITWRRLLAKNTILLAVYRKFLRKYDNDSNFRRIVYARMGWTRKDILSVLDKLDALGAEERAFIKVSDAKFLAVLRS